MIFGRSYRIRTVVNPTAQQLNAFFGVSGQQSLFGGLRGRYTEVSGILSGPTVADLNAALLNWQSYFDGIARVLTDDFGNAWPQVLMDRFEPGERIKQSMDGWYWTEYKGGFRHLL